MGPIEKGEGCVFHDMVLARLGMFTEEVWFNDDWKIQGDLRRSQINRYWFTFGISDISEYESKGAMVQEIN